MYLGGELYTRSKFCNRSCTTWFLGIIFVPLLGTLIHFEVACRCFSQEGEIFYRYSGIVYNFQHKNLVSLDKTPSALVCTSFLMPEKDTQKIRNLVL